MPYNGRVPFAGNLVAGDSLWLVGGLDPAVRDGALAFMQYMANGEAGTARHPDGRTFVPVTESSINVLEREGWFAERPYHRVAVDQLRATTDSPATRGVVFGGFRDVQDVVTAAMHDVLVAGVDPRARFEEATVAAQAIMDAYQG
jgi:sn-glycerol 3-phosphate transport system substrate-binding protein